MVIFHYVTNFSQKKMIKNNQFILLHKNEDVYEYFLETRINGIISMIMNLCKNPHNIIYKKTGYQVKKG